MAFFDPSLVGTSQLVYSTFLGTAWFESVLGIAIDTRGIATATGFTRAPAFPITPGAFDTTYNGAGSNADAFITRIDPSGVGGSSVLYSTYFGSGPGNWFDNLALDGYGGVHVVGRTGDPSFPHFNLLPRLQPGSAALDRVLSCASPHCEGSIVLEVSRQPISGFGFDFLIGNAPRNAIGAIAFGLPTPVVPTLGANVCVNPIASVVLSSDACGSASLPFSYMSGFAFRTQTVWLETGTCAGSQLLGSSAAVDF